MVSTAVTPYEIFKTATFSRANCVRSTLENGLWLTSPFAIGRSAMPHADNVVAVVYLLDEMAEDRQLATTPAGSSHRIGNAAFEGIAATNHPNPAWKSSGQAHPARIVPHDHKPCIQPGLSHRAGIHLPAILALAPSSIPLITSILAAERMENIFVRALSSGIFLTALNRRYSQHLTLKHAACRTRRMWPDEANTPRLALKPQGGGLVPSSTQSVSASAGQPDRFALRFGGRTKMDKNRIIGDQRRTTSWCGEPRHTTGQLDAIQPAPYLRQQSSTFLFAFSARVES